jgi:diguanylate cyclase (GGDEF)-like protein/PAS domain S-box-containing protein
VIDAITRYVAEIVGEASVLASLSDEGRMLLPIATFHPDPEVRSFMQEVLASGSFRVGDGIAGKVAATAEPVVLGDLEPERSASLVSPDSAAFTRRYPIRALMIVPLVANGEVIGTLGVVRTESGDPYAPRDLRTLQALAERAAIALGEGRSRPRPLEAADFEAIFRHSIDGVLFTAPDGRVVAANPAACEILQLSEVAICELGRGGLVVGDDPRSQAAVEQRRVAGHVRAEIPMRRGTGEVFIADISSAVFPGVKGDQHAVVIFRDVTDQVAEREHVARESVDLRELATTDDLTGLRNRRGFLLAAEQVIAFADREDESLQLLYLDLDGLKALNDQRGHAAGDLALRAVGAAIADGIREVDVAGRVGGDEFVVLLYGATPEEAAEVVDRLRAHLAGSGAPATAFSVGIAARPAGAGTSVEDLLDAADRRMYQDKTLRRLTSS